MGVSVEFANLMTSALDRAGIPQVLVDGRLLVAAGIAAVGGWLWWRKERRWR